jgi:hypothetical protein
MKNLDLQVVAGVFGLLLLVLGVFSIDFRAGVALVGFLLMAWAGHE